jgi:hypothetical protein
MIAPQLTMLARACAVWLVALIVAPFSAPFSVCDVATFYDVPQAKSFPAPVKPSRAAASLGDGATHTLPVVRTKPRVKVMDGVAHPSPWRFTLTSLLASHRPRSVPFANSPLATPLRI